jgi:hypothetical protein
MIISLLFALGDWISWPIIFGACILFAIWKKDQVRAAFKMSPFQFSLEAKNLRRGVR